MHVLRGGRTLYGVAAGILMLDTVFPRPRGDIGNAATWPFPVQYRVVHGASPERTVERPDESLLADFVKGAMELEAQGARFITTSCGFLAIYQRELAAAVSVPFAGSALLQVPLAQRAIAPDRRVGVLTMSREHLTARHFTGVGVSAREVCVAGFDEDAVFRRTYLHGGTQADSDVLERELVGLARSLVTAHPEIGALVLECTNFVPYSHAVRGALGLPVFDIYTLVMQTYLGTSGREFLPVQS
jgi:hypothetical protein